MIAPRRIPNRCLGCRTQLLSFYDALLAPQSRASSRHFSSLRAPLTQTFLSLAQPPRSGSSSSARQFSTSRRARRDTAHEHDSNSADTAQEPRRRESELAAEDTETIVRQAKQTFGDTLPPGYLTPEELKLYERLYGPALRDTRPEDVGLPYYGDESEMAENESTRTLLRETEDGQLEEVEYTIKVSEIPKDEDGTASEVADDIGTLEELPPLSNEQVEYLNVTANNQREYDALVRLQRDFELATLKAAAEAALEPNGDDIMEENEPREEDEIEEDEGEPNAVFDEWDSMDTEQRVRLHPHTVMGHFKTLPSTLLLPKETLIQPISDLLKRTSPTHLREAAERVFGGPGLPYSPSTPGGKRLPLQKPLMMRPSQHKLSEIEADVFLATVVPGLYTTAMSILVEVRKRLGPAWIQGLLTKAGGQGPRVLDVGAGGAGLAAWQDVVNAEWDILRQERKVFTQEPPGKKTVVVGSETIRHRISRFMQNTTFLPRLPDYVHSGKGKEPHLDAGESPAPRKTFDIIIASHLMMPLDKPYKRKVLLENLWEMLSPDGGVLIVLEKGHPRGFEAVAEVRRRLLDDFIIPPTVQPPPEEIRAEAERIREPGMIVAPCTNHTTCPLYHSPGLSSGRKDYCHFVQRYTRPSFLQKLHGASHHNYEDIRFSYIAVRRGAQPDGIVSSESRATLELEIAPYLQGKDAADRAFAGFENLEGGIPHPLSLPRNMFPPLKRRGHVLLDMCTPAGTYERWIVARSLSKQAYHDARKARWGDLWALGAKTRIPRNVRLGRPELADGGVRSRAAESSRKRPKVVELNVDPKRGITSVTEKEAKSKYHAAERRTKGGRKVKIDDLMKQMGIDDVEDPDDEEDANFMRGRVIDN
ncbi:Rsm22-domain-containing protein [Lasiosphaeria miniovina]|uniref:Rsm22-domain-containing protein n=1 Tax=Lasiosphaeria miniovina TaxID=1954250 RepID=A0AA40E9W4_9PEZI|nr:Rsm22-domain-containing protein [Lasiosphaeria miniovina]KAK0733744.1 Rsm22-domain-containing protein [Lasiosphaeria miniovina]